MSSRARETTPWSRQTRRRRASISGLVVGLRLGALNHATLTAEAIAARGLRLLRSFALRDGLDPARIGVIGTTGRWLMPQFLTELREAHPNVRPLISEGGTSSLIPRLIAGQLDAAIVHASKIVPLASLDDKVRDVCLDLIYDRRREGYDPLQAFIALFEGRASSVKVKKERPATVEERLKQREQRRAAA